MPFPSQEPRRGSFLSRAAALQNLYAPAARIFAAWLRIKELAKAKRGMLVVFGRSSSLKDSILHHGVTLNADISSSLLLTILPKYFFTSSG